MLWVNLWISYGKAACFAAKAAATGGWRGLMGLLIEDQGPSINRGFIAAL